MPDYDFAAIRSLLTVAFTAATLRTFLQQRPLFEPVVLDFGPDSGLLDMVHRLIDFGMRQLLLEQLLAEVESVCPQEFQQHGPYVRTEEKD